MNSLLVKTLTTSEKQWLYIKFFKAKLYKKRVKWQEAENKRYTLRLEQLKNEGGSEWVEQNDVRYRAYKSCIECPICFLYLPSNINYSVCCSQPICTECFVQTKRSKPCLPHKECEIQLSEADIVSNKLVTKPAQCPYCATNGFSVTYYSPKSHKAGRSNVDATDSSSEGHNSETPGMKYLISSDMIRPNWEKMRLREQFRMEKRSATATAIHVKQRLVSSDHISLPNNQY